jgi:hypothetical protein
MLAVAALVSASTVEVVAEDAGAAIEPLPERVLFIGNSHTQQHGGLHWFIGNMVRSEAQPRPFTGSIETAGGVTLEYHFRNGASKTIRGGDFDAVVLQSYLPGADSQSSAPFLEYAGQLHEVVEASGARTVLFMTWPQDRLNWNWAGLDEFVRSHRQAEAELGVPVAPVGVAFENARTERPDLVLLSEDGVHATWEGAYLAAATVYATLFERSPEGLGYTFGVSDEDAAFLQRVAWQTVTDWNAGVPSAG